MEKRLIVVQNVFDDLKLTEQCIMSMRHASHRWGANFYEICYNNFPSAVVKLMWSRLWVLENCMEYDKVLMVDPDIIINSKSPNIFDELDDDHDLSVVLDGNPGRFENDFIRNGIVKNISKLHNSIQVFKENIEGFDESKYWSSYFNNGVWVFRPKKMKVIFEKFKYLVYNNSKIYDYIDPVKQGGMFPIQNLFNAIITHSNIKVKYLDNTWNWLIPDIVEEYNENFFLSDKMIPNIYHFTGTPNSKIFMKNYTKWNNT
jgi:lipopolysaccharide biosynthesis glycosyltransferase